MSIGVHTNISALISQNVLTATNNALSKSMERLSTGFRINSAADDAAGLQIANRLEVQTRGMEVATRNAQDAVSMLETAEGALGEVSNILMRMNDLALQAKNGTNGTTELAALDNEYQALASEVHAVLEGTTFGGTTLLEGGSFDTGAIVFQIGTATTDELSVDISTAMGNLATLIGDSTATAFGDLTSAANASAAITKLSGASGAFEQIGGIRASLGSNINRLEYRMSNLANMSESLTAAKGRITDVDFAKESAQLTKNQMLMQSGSQMLRTSGMTSSLALSLLG
ncbi:flagellin [Vibrio sp. PNB22_3_1]